MSRKTRPRVNASRDGLGQSRREPGPWSGRVPVSPGCGQEAQAGGSDAGAHHPVLEGADFSEVSVLMSPFYEDTSHRGRGPTLCSSP